MNADETIGFLTSLMYVDVDAVNVYDEALEHVTDEDMRTHFEEFRDEHDYHATVLATEIRALGGEPPRAVMDLGGQVAEMITSIRAATGNEGALRAMRTAERYHHRRYRQAQAASHVAANLHDVLTRFYNDEENHLAYCEKRMTATARR